MTHLTPYPPLHFVERGNILAEVLVYVLPLHEMERETEGEE